MTLTSGTVTSISSFGYIQSSIGAINPADGPTVYHDVNEQSDERIARRITTRWGKGSEFIRFVHTPPLKWDEYIAAGEIYALGTIIPSTWLAHSTGSGASAARLQHVDRREQRGGGGDRVVLTYIELEAGTEANGYAEMSSARQPAEGHNRDVMLIHGVALTRSSTGIPAVGGQLGGGIADSIDDYVCYDVRIDETAQHGRVMVTSYFAALLAGGFAQRT